jgi:hypothetical protein
MDRREKTAETLLRRLNWVWSAALATLTLITGVPGLPSALENLWSGYRAYAEWVQSSTALSFLFAGISIASASTLVLMWRWLAKKDLSRRQDLQQQEGAAAATAAKDEAIQKAEAYLEEILKIWGKGKGAAADSDASRLDAIGRELREPFEALWDQCLARIATGTPSEIFREWLNILREIHPVLVSGSKVDSDRLSEAFGLLRHHLELWRSNRNIKTP